MTPAERLARRDALYAEYRQRKAALNGDRARWIALIVEFQPRWDALEAGR